LKIVIDEVVAREKSRFAAHHLVNFALRLAETWRNASGGDQETLVLMAIVAITTDRLTRTDLDPSFRNMANPIPQELLGECNLSSIAAASGLNRETARRVVNRLIKSGRLTRSLSGKVQFTPGRLQGDAARALNDKQLEDFCRTAEALAREGILQCRTD
jgi:hypothetical protein